MLKERGLTCPAQRTMTQASARILRLRAWPPLAWLK